MDRDRYEPHWEQTDMVLVLSKTIADAEKHLLGCEACMDRAELPFDSVLDQLTGRDPATTEYILEQPATCPFCRTRIYEKTLVTCKSGVLP